MSAPTDARVSKLATGVLAGLGLLAGLWSVYQWMELLDALSGGDVSCAVSETLDCSKVWAAPEAKTIQRMTGVPVAGWGLIWGFAAMVAGVRAYRARADKVGPAVWGTRWVAVAGLASCAFLFAVSARMGVFCPTCLATYVLVGGYAVLAFLGSRAPVPRSVASADLLPVAATVALGWALLLWPGLSTPTGASVVEDSEPEEVLSADEALARLASEMPAPFRGELARIIRTVMTSSASVPAPRQPAGAQAPFHITDFSDVMCGHCRNLVEILHAVRTRYPGRFTEDPRYFPLTGACNPLIANWVSQPTDAARCFATRTLLCLESAPKYHALRKWVFDHQAKLTEASIIEAAGSLLGASKAEVLACQTSTAVQEKLDRDIALARRYDLRGTPLVLVNGVEIPAHPAVVYGLLLSGGNPDHPALRVD